MTRSKSTWVARTLYLVMAELMLEGLAGSVAKRLKCGGHFRQEGQGAAVSQGQRMA